MLDNEVIIEKQDKEILISNIKNINAILDKYPYSLNVNSHLVTNITRVKNISKDAEEWINLLYTKNE